MQSNIQLREGSSTPGFQVLLEGTAAKDDQFYVWTTNSSGVITSGSGWKTTTQAVTTGWENAFATDLNNDGLISGGRSYQLASSAGSISLTDRAERTYSDSSASTWDAIKAVSTNSGFQVLLEGTAAKDDQFYVWTTNSSGVITRGSGWKTTTQAVTTGWENTFATDFNSDGLISGGRSYQLASSAGPITLTNRAGRTYSDSSASTWDAIKAVSTNSGFQVLLEGTAAKDDQFYVWTTNSSGVITSGSGWKTTTQAVTTGWENTFATDFNSDGLISGGRSYQLASSAGPITLTNRAGRTYSDSSASTWDAIKAVSTNSGFQVLLEGTAAKDDQFYVWTTNSSGVITRGSGWKTTTQAVTTGWENTFATDFNSDGLISGGRSYQLASSAGPITLTNRAGRTYSDASASTWDAIKAVSTNSGFQVLLEGTAAKDDQFYVWTTNSSGVIASNSGWKTTTQAVTTGWENTFATDFNSDVSSPAVGLINWLPLLAPSLSPIAQGALTPIPSASTWDAIKAVSTNSGFQVLLEGTAAKDDQFYVWTTNSSGVITRGSGWKTIEQAHNLNWESIFGDLIQPDGIIGSPNP